MKTCRPVFSFKLRGAYNKIAYLSESVAKRGVICASAGNHAQGVALAARHRSIAGNRRDAADHSSYQGAGRGGPGGRGRAARGRLRQRIRPGAGFEPRALLTFVHPFDDPDVIAGQGTIGLEILRQSGGEIDAIFVPVGGGGLISGIAVYVKYLYPKVRIVGVEPEDSAAMYESLRPAGE